MRCSDARSEALLRSPLAVASWALSLYPEAGEAGGCFVGTRRRPPPVARGAAADPERARGEAARRARGRVRRYCAANRLNRLGTLTYAGAGCHDPQQVRRDVGEFFRALREALGGESLPYLWVPEWHPGGHGLHLHFAVGRYVPRRLIDSAWGRGFVHIKLLSNMPAGASTLRESRVTSRYLAKYVSKDMGDAGRGLHRFDVAEGFAPRVVRLVASSVEGALDAACEAMRASPERLWHSSQVQDWQGPPAVWASWAA